MALSFFSALDGGAGQRHVLVPLPRRQTHSTHCVRGWMGLRAGLDGCKNNEIFLPPIGVKPNRSEGLICNSYGKGY